MQEKTYTKAQRLGLLLMAAVFLLAIFAGLVGHLLTPDAELSRGERRKLTKLPAFTLKNLLDGSLSSNFESYAQDQFPLRDTLRTAKALAQYELLLRGDNNGLYYAKGQLGKLEYPLKENEVKRAAERFMALKELYLADANLYYSVVPDKNYFLAEQSGRPAMDYALADKLMAEYMEGFTRIDVTDLLEAADYYATDTHWRQERIVDVARRIAAAMGSEDRISWEFEQVNAGQWYGVYHGQAALPLPKEELIYLTNDVLEAAEVYYMEQGVTNGSIYLPEKLETSMDGYDTFLSGATAYIEIHNPKGGDKQLVIFRDSFGSSMTPLFTEGYGKVTVVDIRYISSLLLGDHLQVDPGDDVLFLYSTLSLNNASILK